jgi:hypothetical protein
MKTVFSNHSEVCKAWAKQDRSYGKAGNISFEWDTIYSYGWWPMARIDGDIALFRAERYSQSTCQHQGHVWQAVYRKYRIFHVASIAENIDHEANIKRYIQQARWAADSFWNSRTRTIGDKALYNATIFEAKRYAEHYEVEHLLPPLFGLELSGPRAILKLEG